MDAVSTLVVFLLLWWWVFLMSLPFGVRTEETPEAGHAPSAPSRPMLLRKGLASTVIAAALTFVVDWVISAEIISLGIPDMYSAPVADLRQQKKQGASLAFSDGPVDPSSVLSP